jgi:hypothetical protein
MTSAIRSLCNKPPEQPDEVARHEFFQREPAASVATDLPLPSAPRSLLSRRIPRSSRGVPRSSRGVPRSSRGVPRSSEAFPVSGCHSPFAPPRSPRGMPRDVRGMRPRHLSTRHSPVREEHSPWGMPLCRRGMSRRAPRAAIPRGNNMRMGQAASFPLGNVSFPRGNGPRLAGNAAFLGGTRQRLHPLLRAPLPRSPKTSRGA